MVDDETGLEPEQPLRAGEVARRTGVSKDALRFYERRGLLAPPQRLANNYRVYPPGTVERVRWIRRVLAAGFTIEELSRILAERDRGGRSAGLAPRRSASHDPNDSGETPMRPLRALPILLLCALPLAAQEHAMDPATCPMHAQHAAAAGLDRRGDATMGFAHERTTHHFLLTADGGVIQVEANDPADTASRDQIRGHLAGIAKQFAAGDFSAPREIHDRVLPGVEEMIRRKDAISWRYEEMETGGRVVISTADPIAKAAVQDFLKAQIADHRTGDPS